MRTFLLSLFILLSLAKIQAQQVSKPDSIFFNLYTDSLKKGTFNYINVDGKFSNGSYLPMTSKELIFTSSHGKFEGNSLFVEKDFKEEKITVNAVLRTDTSVKKTVIIYIKKLEETGRLKTKEEVMRNL